MTETTKRTFQEYKKTHQYQFFFKAEIQPDYGLGNWLLTNGQGGKVGLPEGVDEKGEEEGDEIAAGPQVPAQNKKKLSLLINYLDEYLLLLFLVLVKVKA
jgi:hypothetical protein